MLPELTKLKITTMHCEHLSTHLVTADGQEDTNMRPGYELSVMIQSLLVLAYIQLTVMCKIIIHGGR